MNLWLIETTAESFSTTGAGESPALKRKIHGSDNEEDPKSSKNSRKQLKAAGGQKMPPPDEVPAVDDVVPFGYYAIE